MGPVNWSLFVLDAEHCVNSYQLLLVCISSLTIPISSLRILTGPCCLPDTIQYDATDMMQCEGNTIQYGGVESMRMHGDAMRTQWELVVSSRNWYESTRSNTHRYVLSWFVVSSYRIVLIPSWGRTNVDTGNVDQKSPLFACDVIFPDSYWFPKLFALWQDLISYFP